LEQTVHTPALNWWHPDAAAGAEAPAAARVQAPGRTAFAALVVFTAILIAAPQEFFAALQPLRLALVAAVIAIGFHVVDRLNGRVAAGAPREIALVLALSAWALFMVPLSYWPGGSMTTLTDLYFKSVAIFILLAGVVNTRWRLRAIAWTFAACVVPIALVALKHYATGTFLPNAPGRIAGYGTAGLSGNPNDLALLLNITMPFIGALAATSRSVTARLGAALILLLAAAAVIVTFSRSGFITLTVIAVLYAWRLARRGRGFAIGGLIVAVLIAALAAPAGYTERLGTISSVDSDPTGSSQARWRDMVVATKFAVAHPIFGAGPGQDILALNQMRGQAWMPVHNMYLNYAVDLGLPGLLLFLALFWSALSGAFRVERALASRAGTDELWNFAGAARVSLVALAVAGFFYPIPYQAFFYYIAGLAVAVRGIAVSEARRDARRVPIHGAAMAAVR
jgi:O-antigen ligase